MDRLTGSFPIVGPSGTDSFFPLLDGTNLADGNKGVSGWTPGATLLQTVSTLPTAQINQPWMIYGWAISFSGQLSPPKILQRPSFGRLGALYGGLAIPAGSGQAAAGANPWTTPVIFPQDLSLLEKMWDGSTDPPFPWFTDGQATQNLAPIQYTSSASQPITVPANQNLSIGMWLTPSLVQATKLSIINATWTILYDLGQPLPTTLP